MLKLFLLLLAPTTIFAAQPDGNGKPKSQQRQGTQANTSGLDY